MKNIFENAYFGKPYKRRDGKKVLYQMYDELHDKHFLFDEYNSFHRGVNPDGHTVSYESPYEIISEWQEEINEEELDRLAKEYEENYPLDDSAYSYYCYDGFKAGYRKAKGE